MANAVSAPGIVINTPRWITLIDSRHTSRPCMPHKPLVKNILTADMAWTCQLRTDLRM